jgi:CBS domain-containing membrane protein
MPVGVHWLIAPVGASAILLFALPHAPLAKPWSVLGGYLVSTLAALLRAAWIPMPQLAVAVAVAASVWLMIRLNCVHPPGGALAPFILRNAIATLESFEIQGSTRDLGEWKESPNG